MHQARVKACRKTHTRRVKALKKAALAQPETSCQGLFNQIHEKATKKVPEADFSS